MFCDENCQKHSNDFYDLKEKFTKFFAVINGIFVMAIGIGIFAYSMIPPLGAWMVTISLLVLGTMYFFLPFPPDIMIDKYKIKKSIFICRIIAVILFLLGLTAMFLTLIFVK